MRSIAKPVLLVVSGISILAGLFFVASVMEMYDLKPDRWGPQGVGFEQWHFAWRTRRDLYIWSGVASFVIALACAMAGWLQLRKRPV